MYQVLDSGIMEILSLERLVYDWHVPFLFSSQMQEKLDSYFLNNIFHFFARKSHLLLHGLASQLKNPHTSIRIASFAHFLSPNNYPLHGINEWNECISFETLPPLKWEYRQELGHYFEIEKPGIPLLA